MKVSSAADVLKVAAGQIGYCETPKNSNKTKYGRAFGLNGQPWCSIFIWWCFQQAKCGSLFPHNANAAYAQDEVVSKCGGSWIMKKNTNKNTRKAYLNKAKPGDIVCFDFGKMNAYRQHIGIVESVSGQYLICIEGNTSKAGSQSNGGMVVRQRRIYTSICSAARPKWSGSPTPAKKYTGTLPTLPKRGWFQKGDKGAQVKLLQKFLIWAGFSCGPSGADGELGPKTVFAIKSFQITYGLSVDGGWGTQCQKQAQSMTETKPAPAPTKTNADKIVEMAKKCAWPYGTAKSKYAYPGGSPTAEFKKAIAKAYPDRSKWGMQTRAGASCDVFAGTVIRASGVDPKFPRGLDGVVKHCKGNPKWQLTGVKSVKDMKPGDVVYMEWKGGGHIYIYLGNDRCANAHYVGKSYGIIQKASDQTKSASKCQIFNVYRAK